jgi:transmembrane sensor
LTDTSLSSSLRWRVAAANAGSGKGWHRRGIVRTAALIAVTALSTLVWRASVQRPAVEDVASRDISTRAGQRATFELPDGTRVTLAPASVLRMPVRMARDSREVFLTGEAYFEVTHDEERPFFVHAGGTVTRVLGTEFAVRAYAHAGSVEVVVRSGRVSLREAVEAAEAVVLTPGQLGTFADGRTVVRAGVDVAEYLAWTEGRMVLDDVTVAEALERLRRWYAVEISADRALLDRRMTAVFRNQSIESVLEALTLSLGVQYDRRGDAYHLYERKQ